MALICLQALLVTTCIIMYLKMAFIWIFGVSFSCKSNASIVNEDMQRESSSFELLCKVFSWLQGCQVHVHHLHCPLCLFLNFCLYLRPDFHHCLHNGERDGGSMHAFIYSQTCCIQSAFRRSCCSIYSPLLLCLQTYRPGSHGLPLHIEPWQFLVQFQSLPQLQCKPSHEGPQ